MKHIKKTKLAPNQSYDHMRGDVSKPQDHPAFNLPDPSFLQGPGQINPPGAITGLDGTVME